MEQDANFLLQAQRFDPSNGWNVLRILCGVFLMPHAWGKVSGMAWNPDDLALFTKAGWVPAHFWVGVAFVAQWACAIGLILGVRTRWAALGAAALLILAAATLQVVQGFRWKWNTGGMEYLIFWAITSVMVALHAQD